MKTTFIFVLGLAAAGSLLSACSPGSNRSEGGSPLSTLDFADGSSTGNLQKPQPTGSRESSASEVLGLGGLGDLRIGRPVPAGSKWAERGAQAGTACRTVNSPEYPGVYAIVEDNRVERITVGKRSDVKLAEGIGVGASEADVRKWFAGFREEPHKYEEAPSKYLTAPNAASGDPALRFEIGSDGKVGLIHVGTMPVLAYVEGCG